MEKDKMSDPLEFNDGVGDMLRFGKRQRRKWWRLPFLAIIAIVILFISFLLSYQLGKILFLPKTNAKTFVPDNVKEPRFDELEQEFAYKENDKETKEPTKNIKSQEVATKNTEKQKTKEKTDEKIPTKSVQKEINKQIILKDKTKEKIKTKQKEISATKNESSTIKEINYKVIAGAYSKKEKALEKARSLLDQGFSAFVWQNNNLWKVQIGSFKSKEHAEDLKKKAEDAGHKAIIIND